MLRKLGPRNSNDYHLQEVIRVLLQCGYECGVVEAKPVDSNGHVYDNVPFFESCLLRWPGIVIYKTHAVCYLNKKVYDPYSGTVHYNLAMHGPIRSYLCLFNLI